MLMSYKLFSSKGQKKRISLLGSCINSPLCSLPEEHTDISVPTYLLNGSGRQKVTSPSKQRAQLYIQKQMGLVENRV